MCVCVRERERMGEHGCKVHDDDTCLLRVVGKYARCVHLSRSVSISSSVYVCTRSREELEGGGVYEREKVDDRSCLFFTSFFQSACI